MELLINDKVSGSWREGGRGSPSRECRPVLGPTCVGPSHSPAHTPCPAGAWGHSDEPDLGLAEEGLVSARGCRCGAPLTGEACEAHGNSVTSPRPCLWRGTAQNPLKFCSAGGASSGWPGRGGRRWAQGAMIFFCDPVGPEKTREGGLHLDPTNPVPLAHARRRCHPWPRPQSALSSSQKFSTLDRAPRTDPRNLWSPSGANLRGCSRFPLHSSLSAFAPAVLPTHVVRLAADGPSPLPPRCA